MKDKLKKKIAELCNEWYYFNEIEEGKQVRKRRCLKTLLVQRLEKKEVWVFVSE